MTRLANNYNDGSGGVEQNFAEAATWYRKLAELGDIFSQTMLAGMYADGRGVGQDHAAAAKLYAEAAGGGYAIAQYHLGLSYRDGHGVPQDDVQAHKWLNLAAIAANPFAEAGQARDQLAATMTPEQITAAQRLASAWKPQ